MDGQHRAEVFRQYCAAAADVMRGVVRHVVGDQFLVQEQSVVFHVVEAEALADGSIDQVDVGLRN